jgi:GT2 family glycosyltransferase
VSGLTVLTLVKGREAHLAQQIEGLRRSTVPPAAHIIVNMGGGPLALPPSPCPRTVVDFPTDGLPLAAARNRAAAQAGTDMLLFLDVDCIPQAGLLAAMETAMRTFDGLLCAEIRYLAGDEARGDWDEALLLRTALPHPARDFPAAGLRLEANAGLFWSLAFAVHRRTFAALGGFDERFTGYGAEDTDFSLRARAAGLPLAFLGGACAFHQHHDVYDPPLQHFEDILKNAQLFYDLHGTWPMRGWLDAFVAMGLTAFENGHFSIVRRPSARELAAAKKSGAARF